MDKKLIKLEAIRIKCDLARLDTPNSPNGTHYMTKLSGDFIKNAASKDMDLLLNYLKGVMGLYISSIKGEKGLVATTKYKYGFERLTNGTTRLLLIDKSTTYALLTRETSGTIIDPSPFIAAWAFNKKGKECSWGQGHYISDLDSAAKFYVNQVIK